jgi:hypothetical protein
MGWCRLVLDGAALTLNGPSAALVDPDVALVGARLRTPRAAAIAGIVFSILLITSLLLLQVSVPKDPLEIGAWLRTSSERVFLALNLIPFCTLTN